MQLQLQLLLLSAASHLAETCNWSQVVSWLYFQPRLRGETYNISAVVSSLAYPSDTTHRQ
jgi:hypothetical protein